ncbi:MAG: hypothetical protein L3J23_05365 [Flavobacteriaceae bacterium]|nr:hypothetical protein [Flavobacteriaceae bacterium]
MCKRTLYLLIIVIIIESCTYFKPHSDNKGKIIARVNDVFLYEDEIKSILPKKYAAKDSTLLVSNYINSWAKRQLLFSKATLNLKDKQKEIEELVTKYHQDLLINRYKKAVISQELDTLILENDIKNFYKKNQEIFKLNEKLVKLKFLQLRKNVLDIDEIEKLFKSDKSEDILELMEKEFVFKSFHFNDSIWIKLNDVLKLIPVLKGNENKIVSNNFIKKKSGKDVYLIKINKILNRNKLAPISYVKSTIEQMILHKRKLLLVKDIEKILLNDATKNGKYEVY